MSSADAMALGDLFGRARCALALAIATFATPGLAAEPETPRFSEVAAAVGVSFVHQDGRTGQKHYPETTASGGGWLDHDGDGDLDLYLINGSTAPDVRLDPVPRNALYENRNGRFVDVTEASGTGDDGYGMGMCVGDYDADGRLDMLVTNYGADRLYRNLGEGRFEEVGRSAGIAGNSWSSSCAFGDLDSDGDLDLYVTHYLDFTWSRNPLCTVPADGSRMYCHPSAFQGVTDALFVNQGDGTFTEESRARGLVAGGMEKGLGVVVSDLDADGDLDIYVANDGMPNRLYANDGSGQFEDVGLLAGVALSRFGSPQSGMGIATGDTDGDGRLDLVVTNFALEYHALYRQREPLQFEDMTAAAGLEHPTHMPLGWGVQLFDADNDADLDLAIATGHMQDDIERIAAGQVYAQTNLLLRNNGSGRFHDVSADSGQPWQVPTVSRGMAVADWNDDGRLDLLITNTNAAPHLLLNQTESAHHWLGIDLVGPAGNRHAIGARVEIETAAGQQVRDVRSGGFQGQSDLRLHFGLGGATGPVTARIRWPDGHLQTARTEQLDRYWKITYER